MAAKKKKDNQQGIDIRLDSQDHSLIDRAIRRITEITTEAGGKIIGPVPLHTRKIKLEDQVVRKYRRKLVITNPDPKLLEVLASVEVPNGVNIVLKLEDDPEDADL
jgi:small subunit ribosomal protein S10